VKISLAFHCRDDFVTSEHYELTAVLKNLVSNAIESIESGSGRGKISIEEQLSDGFYIFKVTDDGPGISPRHLPNIFQMGYSTKFDYKTGNISRGVGLYGVKSTVEEKFRGTIEVSSIQNEATVFTIKIPAGSLEEAAQ
jgi:two-component system sensor histidine kinase YcbA